MKQKKYYLIWTLVMSAIITGIMILPAKNNINPEKWKGIITTTIINHTPFRGTDLVAERSGNVLTFAENRALILYSENSSIEYEGYSICLQRVYIEKKSIDFIFVDNALVLMVTDRIKEGDKPLWWNEGFPPHKDKIGVVYSELIKNLK